MEDLSGNWSVYLKLFPSNTELRGRPAVSAPCFHTECQPNDGENYPRRCWGRITERPKHSHVGTSEECLQKHIVQAALMNYSFTEMYLYICFLCCFAYIRMWKFQWRKGWKKVFFVVFLFNHPHSEQVGAGLVSVFVSALFLKTLVFRAFGSDEAARLSPASLGSHRIPCPITGRRGLKRGRITLSQQTTGNRKTESAASHRSSQPSTISHGLVGLQLHLLHQIRSFRSGVSRV